MKKPSLFTATLIGLLFCSPASSYAAEAKSIDLKYRIFVGGLETGEVVLQIEHKDDNYLAKSEIRSLGLVDTLIRFRSISFSEGHVTNNIVSPVRHESHNMWRGDPRSVVMSYNGNGPEKVKVQPLPEDDDRLPVSNSMKISTVDALSAALVTSLSAMSNENRCNTSVPIFDGRRRYNIHVKGEENQEIEGPLYSGPTYRCKLSIERIAGHSSSPWMPQQDDESGKIWFARLTETWTPVPVRFEADIGMGSVIIHLTHASGVDIDPKYRETKVASD
jgi:hypothetical protein